VLRPLSSLDLIRSSAREFAETVLEPVAKKIDEENVVPEEIRKEVADMGYFALRVPEEYGGPGLSLLETVVVAEELSRVSSGVGIMATVSGSMVPPPLMFYADKEVKEEYLTKLAKGAIGAFALTEPCCGTDAAAVTTKAELRNGEWVISGRKTFITNAYYADFFIVAARTGKPEDRHRGVSLFVVDRDKSCMEISKLEMMGYRGSGTSEVLFNECKVPKQNIIGPVNGGFKIAMDALNEGRIVTAATGLGVMQAAFEEAFDYAKKRESMGKPIIEHGMVMSMIAEMKVKLEAVRSLIYKAAEKVDKEEPDYPMWSSIAKWAAAKWGVDVVRLAMQVLGGFGYSKESKVERLYRDIKMIEIGDGTNQAQEIVIVRSLLGRIRPPRHPS
jgi:alkylation response protein AidB-like acyl-CoA dehydrogenase